MDIIPLGDSALIVRVRDRFDDAPEETLDTVLRAFQQLRGANIPGVIELAPAYTSVAVFFDPVAVARATETPDKMFEWLATRIRGVVAAGAERGRHRSGASPVVRLLKIPVCYDREFALDIDDVARCAKTSPSEVVRLHSAAEYRVACIGFVPGFPFLTGLPKELATPRREVPRKEIPLGSVGIGGAQTGIYPLRSPGGWNLIGRTPLRLFDSQKNPPALLRAGDRVRFRKITRDEFEVVIHEPSSRAQSRVPVAIPSVGHGDSSTSVGMIATIQRAGFLTSVQDLGRTGLREFGVSSGGALNSFGLRVANLLVGNHEGAAGLEITLGGLQLRFEDERIVAWCGGEFDVSIGSTQLPPGHAGHVQAGERLKFGRPQIGCRAWLAVSGGIDVPAVLGSQSTDLRAQFGGFGGRTLRDGDELHLGTRPGSSPPATGISTWTAPHDWVSPAMPKPILRFVRGVDWDRFNTSTLRHLTTEAFTVSPDSDRMGVRLEGPELKRTDESDLISEAVAPGTIQVPPNGKPILLLGDCQTIGGYPKIAHVITVDLPLAAQLRAGDRVRFSEVSIADAYRFLLERERQLERFRIGLSLHDS
ncbi:MAG: urea amidolyase [Verrucomicrobia bacterium]|nr:MAG: urea amidolyase [Verrucomicrobiota bacterium]